MSLRDWKFLLVNKGKGVIDSNNPITSNNLVRTEKPLIEKDPTVPNWVKNISQDDIADWIEGFNNNIISGSVTGDENKVLTLTKRDGTTLTIPFTDLSGLSTDDVINTLNFNATTGVMTAVTSEGVQVTTNLDGRYALLGHVHTWTEITNKPTTFPPEVHTHNYDNYSGWNIQVNGGSSTQISSDENVNFSENSNYPNIKISRSGNNIYIKRIPKPIIFYNNNSLSPAQSSQADFFGNRWIHIKPLDASNQDYTITIGETSAVKEGFEMEGTFEGEGILTIQAVDGINLIYPEQYFTPTYPSGGVFGIKMVTDTDAHIFGTLRPIGL